MPLEVNRLSCLPSRLGHTAVYHVMNSDGEGAGKFAHALRLCQITFV